MTLKRIQNQAQEILLLKKELGELMGYVLCAIPTKGDIQVCEDITTRTGVTPIES